MRVGLGLEYLLENSSQQVRKRLARRYGLGNDSVDNVTGGDMSISWSVRPSVLSCHSCVGGVHGSLEQLNSLVAS